MSNAITRIKAVRKPNSNSKPFKGDEEKVALLFINSYLGTSFSLGDGPCNDGLTMRKQLKDRGYECFIYFDIDARSFLDVMASFTSAPFKRLVIYYSGHGTYFNDKSGDETDGRDEAFVFKDAAILDDDLNTLIRTANKDCELLLLSDCCHSGSIFDLDESLPNVLAVSAAQDDETAKQTRIERKDQGVFTYYFWKLIDETKSIAEIKDRLNYKLSKYHQHCVLSGGCLDMKL